MGKRSDRSTDTSTDTTTTTDASGAATPIARTRTRRATTAPDDLDSVNVRFPREVGARLDHFIESELKVQAPWTTPSRADAVRALVMMGLPKPAPSAPVPPPLHTPGYVGPGTSSGASE